MAQLTIGGKAVTIDDGFLSLAPEQQQATVDEIAKSLGLGPAEKTEGGFAPRSVREFEPTREQRQASYREMARGVRERMGTGAAVLDTLGRGLGRVVPGMDNIAAGLDTLTGVGRGDSFQDNLDRQRAMSAVDDTDRPVTSYGAQIGGSLVLPGFGLANKGLKGGAVLGAGYGAAYGAAEGDTLAERAGNAVSGAAVGGAIGGVLGKAAQYFSRPAAEAAEEAIPPVVAAGQRLGVEVPRMIASDSRTVQAAGQVARQLPIGGERIENAADRFFTGVAGARDDAALAAAGRSGAAVAPGAPEVGALIRSGVEREAGSVAARNDVARRAFDDLAPGAASGTRAEVGDEVAAALARRVAANRQAQEAPYADLRRMIDAERNVPVSRGVSEALSRIMRERAAAGQREIPNELLPLADIATRPGGASFAGLQRARTTLGEMIDTFEPGRGFNIGDLKSAYGALTDAMRHATIRAAAPGKGKDALAAFNAADKNFARLADENAALSGALRSGSESLVDRMIGYAGEKGGASIERLRALQAAMAPEEFQRVSRLAFDRLGRGADGEFDAATLVKQWQGISPEGRAALFGDRARAMDAAVRNITDTNAATSAAGKELAAIVSGTDSQVVDRLLAMASSGSKADLQRLIRMQPIIGTDAMKGLASVAVQRMGINNKGDFSAPLMVSGWEKLSGDGKALLFPDKAVRQAMEDIVTLSRRMVDVEGRFANRSQTGRTVGWSAFGAGMLADPLSTLATALGGDLLARSLAKPATAKATANWARAYEVYVRKPTAASTELLQRASRTLSASITTEFQIPQAANDIGAALMGVHNSAAGNNED